VSIVGGIYVAPASEEGLGTGRPDTFIEGSKLSPGGIESILEFSGLYLNMRDWVDTYIIDSYSTTVEIRAQSLPNPGFDGETPLKTVYGARNITLGGYIRAHTLWKMRDMEDALRRAFNNIRDESPLSIIGGVPERNTVIWCKKSSDVDIPDTQTDFQFKRKFQIQLRAGDPRFYSSRLELVQAGIQATPVFEIQHNGTYDTLPEIHVTGPITDLMMTHTDLAGKVTVTKVKTGVTIPAGETWVFNSKEHTVQRLSDQANRFSSRDPQNSKWINFPPGGNTIEFTGTGITPDTLAAVFYRHARV
jgi:hypothetical protein